MPLGRGSRTVWARCVFSFSQRGSQDGLQACFQFCGQAERIERVKTISELATSLAGELSMRQQPLEGCLWQVLPPHPPTAHPPFVQQLSGRKKEVVQRSPPLGVEPVYGLEQPGLFQPSIAQQLARPHPVLLFDMRIVVLVIGARTRHPHRLWS